MQYQIALNHINDTIFELLVSKLWVKTSQFSNMNFKQDFLKCVHNNSSHKPSHTLCLVRLQYFLIKKLLVGFIVL